MTLTELIDKGIITKIETESLAVCDTIDVYFKSPNKCDMKCTIYDDSIQIAVDIINCLYDNQSCVNSSTD